MEGLASTFGGGLRGIEMKLFKWKLENSYPNNVMIVCAEDVGEAIETALAKYDPTTRGSSTYDAGMYLAKLLDEDFEHVFKTKVKELELDLSYPPEVIEVGVLIV